MKSKIKITGIKTIGNHGANPGEQDSVQTFYVDLEISVDVLSDDLDQTLDYRYITEAVKRLVEQKQFKLIETLAGVLAKKIGNQKHVDAVKVIVHKPNAAKFLLVEDVSAEAVYKEGSR